MTVDSATHSTLIPLEGQKRHTSDQNYLLLFVTENWISLNSIIRLAISQFFNVLHGMRHHSVSI